MKVSRIRAAVVAGGIVLIGVGAVAVLGAARKPRLTPAMRGARAAGDLGCFACHGPRGTGGVPNPGSDGREVPAWDGGTAMMYVKGEEEIREWILDGRPKRLAHESNRAALPAPGSDSTPGLARDRARTLPLRMPAFAGIVSNGELDDLIAFYKAVAAFEAPPQDAAEGYRVASRMGCFGCHGPGGRIGSSNPRSFKGYIPPWQGADFAELARNDSELRKWILRGGIDRLDSNPLARFFTRRQVIHMPAYRSVLDDAETDALIAYIHWLQPAEP
jgi:mono/diheme cytochrome c family protein